MPVFISYSHDDSEFATNLAQQLVLHKTRVWIDTWELTVGDSLIDQLQAAIKGASALLVILSKSSVESEWCKKELSTGLLRELNEKKTIVLPVVIDDCEIPLFLQGKLYADFRKNPDKALDDVLNSIARVTSDTLGRVENPEWNSDWSLDWGMRGTGFVMQLTIVDHGQNVPYSALTTVEITGNKVATKRFLKFVEAKIEWINTTAIILGLSETVENEGAHRILLEDAKPSQIKFVIEDQAIGGALSVVITSRRLGEDTGRDVLLDIGATLRGILESRRQSLRAPTAEELQKLNEIIASFA